VSKVSQHLAGFHKTAAAHHAEMAVSHRTLSEHFEKCASMSKVKQADESAAELLQGCADAHSHAANSHDAQAEYHQKAMEACSKAIEASDLEKSDMEPLPAGLSRVAPERTSTIRAVPRTGAPQVPVEKGQAGRIGGIDFVGLRELDEI
jgi:hypothetical protein